MSYPLSYQFTGSPFTSYETIHITAPGTGAMFDAEFAKIATAQSEHLAFTRKIQADDGGLRSGIVGPKNLTGNLLNSLLQYIASVIEDKPWRLVLAAVDQHTAGAGQTVFPLSVTPTVAANVIVTVNGLLQPPTGVYSFSGDMLVFNTGLLLGQAVVVRHFGGATITVDQFVASAGQTTFKLSKEPFDPAFLLVSVSGVAQAPNTNFVLNGRNVIIEDVPTGAAVCIWTLREMEISSSEFTAIGWCASQSSCGC